MKKLHIIIFMTGIVLSCAILAHTSPLTRPVQKATPPIQKSDRIELLHADILKADARRYPDAQILVGNVQLLHDGMYMYCDSAVFYNGSNSCMAQGHVKMVQGDTLTLKGDSLFYDGFSAVAQMYNNVVLVHRQTTLYTDELYYERHANRGFFVNGGKLIDGKSNLTSNEGEYHSDTRQATFYYNVELLDPQFRLVSDTLHYDTQSKWSHVTGPSNIYDGDNRIYTENGYFNSTTESARLYDRPTLYNKNTILKGDSIYYEKSTALSEAWGNIYYKDPDNKNIFTNGDYGFYNDSTGEALTYGPRCLGKDFSQGNDTLFVHGDTLRLYSFNLHTDSMFRVMHAYPHVRSYQSSMQAVSDSLIFNSKEHKLSLFKDPITWNDNRQILGEEINIFLNDSTIDSIYVERQCLMEERIDSAMYNQVAGNIMRIYYEGKEVRDYYNEGNGITILYSQEKDSTYLYQHYLEASKMRAHFADKALKRFWAYPSPESKTYAIGLAPQEHCFLPGFAWFDYIRPTSENDIYEWRSKKAGSELKWMPRRDAPLQYLSPKAENTSTETKIENEHNNE